MWTAIALWTLNLAGLAAYIYGATVGIARGIPAWWFVLGLPVAYLAIVFVVTLFYFALSWWFRAERPPDVRLSTAAIARMIWHEFWTLAGSAPRMMLYKLLVSDPPPRPATAPLLLLHGVLCNAGVWNRLSRFLGARGIGSVYTLSYGPPLASIDMFADQVAAKIDAVLAATGAAQVTVVGHSMGGLVARAYLAKYGGAKVRRVITIGTPHHGSVFAYLSAGTSMSQLRPGNPWLGALPPVTPGLPPIVSIWSWHDSMVAPQTSARLDGAANIALAGVGHNALLGDSRVFDLTLEEIRKAGVRD